MISPELYRQENERLRDVLQEGNDYLENIYENLKSSFDFTKEKERQRVLEAEKAELATLEMLKEASREDKDDQSSSVTTVTESGSALGDSLAKNLRGPNFLKNLRTGLAAGLSGLGLRLLRGGGLAGIALVFGDEIAKVLSSNVGDALELAGFEADTVLAIEEGLEKYVPAISVGAAIGMIFKRTGVGALAGFILKRLGVTQEGLINTGEQIYDEIEDQLNALGYQIPESQEVLGFLDRGATGASMGFLLGTFLRRGRLVLSIAGFLADTLGLDKEKLGLFAEHISEQVESSFQSSLEEPDYEGINMQRDVAANIDLPSGREATIAAGTITMEQLQNRQSQISPDESVYDQLSWWQKTKGMGPLKTDVEQAFDAATVLQENYLANPDLDMNNIRSIPSRQLLDIQGDLNSGTNYIDDFLNMSTEIQDLFATPQQLQYLAQVKNISRQIYGAISWELSQRAIPGSPAAIRSAEMRQQESSAQNLSEPGLKFPADTGPVYQGTIERSSPEAVSFEPTVGQNEVSLLSRDVAEFSRLVAQTITINNISSVDQSSTSIAAGGGNSNANVPAGRSYNLDQSYNSSQRPAYA